MRGLFRYTPKVETPQQAFIDAQFPLDAAYPLADTVPAGSTVSIFLPYYEVNKPMKRKTLKESSVSASGVVQTLFQHSEKGRVIGFNNIKENREGNHQVAIYDALNDALDMGLFVQWYPDVEQYPNEYHTCWSKNIAEASREKHRMRWTYTYNLLFVAGVQAPSVVPSFI